VWIQGLHWYLWFAGLVFVFGFKNCVGHIGHFSSVGSNITFSRVLMRVHWILRIFPFVFLHLITHLVSRPWYYVSTQNSDLESATDAIDVLQTLFYRRQTSCNCMCWRSIFSRA
jgi:hypothetical protein